MTSAENRPNCAACSADSRKAGLHDENQRQGEPTERPGRDSRAGVGGDAAIDRIARGEAGTLMQQALRYRQHDQVCQGFRQEDGAAAGAVGGNQHGGSRWAPSRRRR